MIIVYGIMYKIWYPSIQILNWPTPFIWFSPLYCCVTFIINQMTVYVSVWRGTVCFVHSFICLYMCLPIPYYLNCYSLIFGGVSPPDFLHDSLDLILYFNLLFRWVSFDISHSYFPLLCAGCSGFLEIRWLSFIYSLVLDLSVLGNPPLICRTLSFAVFFENVLKISPLFFRYSKVSISFFPPGFWFHA